MMGCCARCAGWCWIDGNGYCGGCASVVRAEVKAGFRMIDTYLARWAEFDAYLREHGLVPVATLAAVALLAAGCGTRTVVVTKTIRPCVGKAAFARCLEDQATLQARYNGSTSAFRVRCARAPRGRFSCTASFVDACYHALAVRARSGVPSLLTTTRVDPARCARVFGAA